MRIRETKKWLTISQLKAGQEIVWYKNGKKCISPAYSIIKEINNNTLILTNKFDKSSTYSLTPTDNVVFEVYLTEEEFINKYHELSKPLYEILKGSEYIGDKGYHSMDNSWLASSLEELYYNLSLESFKLIGWFSLPEIKHGFFDDSDIGIILEDSEEERFWCHFKKQSIDWMVVKYEKGIV